MKSDGPILVVDDEVEMRIALSATLKRCDLKVELSHNAKDAISKIAATKYSLVLTDMTMPKKSGVELLKEIKALQPDLPVIIMTAHGTIETAVESMKHGAFDYILKPFDFDTVVFLIERALSFDHSKNRPQAISTNTARPKASTSRADYKEIISKDPKMMELLKIASSLANSRSTVLIEAESGTGKEMLANYIHVKSERAKHPFVAVNCAALPEALLESELFGHKKGAFTGAVADHKGKFEQANGGTILLDEITEMSLPLQAKLLRVLQEFKIDKVGGVEQIPVDVRVIATSNRNVLQHVEDGKFREDLYFRLNVIPLVLPPLRDRPGDIEVLAEHFVIKHSELNGIKSKKISADALKVLLSYHWRGNIRELENVIERACQLAVNSLEINAEHLLLGKNISSIFKSSTATADPKNSSKTKKLA